MHRTAHVALATTLVLVSSAFVAGAVAQDHGPHGGGPGGAAAPAARAAPAAPHFAAPAPHIQAPPVAPPAPHFAAPAPHAAPPQYAAPRMATPHIAAPHEAATRFASRPAPQIARHAPPQAAQRRLAAHEAAKVAPHGVASRVAKSSGRARESSKAASSTSPQLSKAQAAAPSNAAGQQVGGRQPAPKTTVGRATGDAKGALAPAERARIEQARRQPIISNPVFASTSPASGSQARFTFRGGFAQSPWLRDGRHHRAGIVLGFIGPLFWPYAYDDFVDYTFVPYAYDTFWPYAFDDVLVGIYGDYAPEYAVPEGAFAYAGAPVSARSYERSAREAPSRAAQSRICSGEAQGVTDFSIQKVAEQVKPDAGQRVLLAALKDATAQAVDVLREACPIELPSTPPGRLAAMQTRVDAMLRAVRTVRPALDKFYQSLSDEQRERFNALDQTRQAASSQRTDLARVCDNKAAATGVLPLARIEHTLHLNAAQDAALNDLDRASAKSAEILRAKCEPVQTLTPPGRLAAMEERLSEMSRAMETTKTALTKFYRSLNDEQKAQLDRMDLRRNA